MIWSGNGPVAKDSFCLDSQFARHLIQSHHSVPGLRHPTPYSVGSFSAFCVAFGSAAFVSTSSTDVLDHVGRGDRVVVVGLLRYHRVPEPRSRSATNGHAAFGRRTVMSP